MAFRTLRQRVVGGAGAQAFAQLLQVIVRLAEVPLFLAIWSPTRYGEWLLIAAIPSYLSLADGGFASTSGREMTMRIGSGDVTGAARVFQSSWVLLTSITAGTLSVIALLIFGTHVLDWFVTDVAGTIDIKVSLILLCIYVLAGFQTGLYYGVFCAEGRYDLATWLSSGFLLLDLLLSALGAAIANTLIGAALGLVISRLILIALYVGVLQRVAPWCRHGFRDAEPAVLRRLVAPSLGSMAFPIGIGANISGMRILVGAVLGPAAVPLFSAMRTIARAAQMPTLFVIRILEPELAIAFGREQFELFRILVRRSCQIAIWSGAVITMAVLAVSPMLFPVWVHHRFAVDIPTFLILLTASAVNGLWYTALQVAYATNRTHSVALPFAIIYGLGCVGVGWLALHQFGIAGAGLSILLAEVAMSAIVIPLALRLSGEDLGRFLRVAFSPPVGEISQLLRTKKSSFDRS